MGDRTAIGWTDATWNPTVGCSHVSPGCDNCYAAREAAGRLAHLPAYVGIATREAGQPARFTGEVRTLADRLDQPLRWKRPRRVFVDSMSDLFHPKVLEAEFTAPQWSGPPTSFLAEVFAVMAAADRHTFQVLTKRPQIMAAVLGHPRFRLDTNAALLRRATPVMAGGFESLWPSNIWLGTSIESDRYSWRTRPLRDTPASTRFLSLEPLLGPLPSLDLTGMDWVIVGGESGPGARPMDAGWVRDLRDRCAEGNVCPCVARGPRYSNLGPDHDGSPVWCEDCDDTGRKPVAFYFKQAGAVLAKTWGATDGKGHELAEIPEEFRVRQYPVGS